MTVHNVQQTDGLQFIFRHWQGHIPGIGHIGGLRSFVMLSDCKCPHSESAVISQQGHSHSSCFQTDSPCTHVSCHSSLW